MVLCSKHFSSYSEPKHRKKSLFMALEADTMQSKKQAVPDDKPGVCSPCNENDGESGDD